MNDKNEKSISELIDALIEIPGRIAGMSDEDTEDIQLAADKLAGLQEQIRDMKIEIDVIEKRFLALFKEHTTLEAKFIRFHEGEN